MDYVVGSVAALISGNVTPNRPKLIRKALTPTKHQPSPNVTPKSELVEDRSIFLSPTLQKKKAIVKKSPKRIFQNPDLDATEDCDGNSSMSSTTAEKVKKHLKNELGGDEEGIKAQKSPKNKNNIPLKSFGEETENMETNFCQSNENTPKKNKKRKLQSDVVEEATANVENVPLQNISSNIDNISVKSNKSPKKLKERRKSTVGEDEETEIDPVMPTPSGEEGNVEKSNSKKSKSEDSANLSLSNPKASSPDKMSKSQKRRLKKKLKLQSLKLNNNQSTSENIDRQLHSAEIDNNEPKANKKSKQKKTLNTELEVDMCKDKTNFDINKKENEEGSSENKSSKKIKKNKSKSQQNSVSIEDLVNNESGKSVENNNSGKEITTCEVQIKKSKKKNKVTENTKSIEENKTSKKSKLDSDMNKEDNSTEIKDSKPPKEKKKNFVNPNAITDKDSDSEHESDNEIDSETEQINKTALETTLADNSSDEEENEKETIKEKKITENVERKMDADEVKRTLFVGNVPFSAKCKKQIKKIFNKYGKIETVRIRTVPIKDARVTPKLAVIKNELHPDRTTVNMYIKYADPESVEQALVENNTVLEENHLRVTRSESTGAEHDPRQAIFVGNLPFAIEDDTLRAKFEKCGQIESVRIIRDKKTNAGKGFGYVNFASKDGVELALALSEEELTIKNRILRVKRCTQVTHKQSQRQTNPKWGPKTEERGAFRRLMHKRKYQDGNGDGPPNKRPNNLNQPSKEKKPRKEFVGMTAEKKKKRKFDKGQKKRKVLSQILTNK
ncbi:hypothetical protein K1T71_013452 [Dendrolimus kikuchii]|uniref:Uncharacterized protein n=1 Tax=Dendrolimus kikuchii TaxID=765133 RepID=A0ACC1CGP3_9NEOP|nr:hypothetical protein K1T71_013452 [Dendrolimus kikuchii]